MRPVLSFDPKFLGRVISGDKELTIRRGGEEKYDFRPDDEVLLDFPDRAVLVGVISGMRFTTIDNVREDEARADGYEGHDELVEVLRGYYPNLERTDPAVVIQFERFQSVEGMSSDT